MPPSQRLRSRRRPSSGLTLVELLVTLVVLGIVLSIGVPSLRGIINGGKLSAVTNELVGAVHAARTEAIRRNGRVVLCQSADGSTCSTSADWAGWLIFADVDGSGAVSAGDELIKSGRFDDDVIVRASPAIAGRSHSLRFAGEGRALGDSEGALFNARLLVCIATTQPNQNVRDLFIAFGGRTTVQSRANDGSCPSAPGDT